MKETLCIDCRATSCVTIQYNEGLRLKTVLHGKGVLQTIEKGGIEECRMGENLLPKATDKLQPLIRTHHKSQTPKGSGSIIP